MFSIFFDAAIVSQMNRFIQQIGYAEADFHTALAYMAYQALQHEAELLRAVSPVRTGALKAGYTVAPYQTGAILRNNTHYFAFNVLGTGIAGSKSGVPLSQFPGWAYGSHGGPRFAGMKANPGLLRTWLDAPNEIADFIGPRFASSFLPNNILSKGL